MMAADFTMDGATPIGDISGLKIKGIISREQLLEAEFVNINQVVFKYLSKKPTHRMAPFDLNWLLKLHKEMFGRVWKWAGEIRTAEINLPFCCPPIQIREALYNLTNDLPAWRESGMDIIEQAAWLHYRAVKIHPFKDGNGRWARLLSNIWLKKHDHPVTKWPDNDITNNTSSIRNEYLSALKAADSGDMLPLITLHKTYTS